MTSAMVSWEWRLDVLAVVAGSAATYLIGWLRLRRVGGAGTTNLAAYAGGLLAIVVALLSPIDFLATRLLTAHMAQHVLLMMVAPPLLLVANPFPVMLWGLPRSLRHRIGRLFPSGTSLRTALSLATFMPVAWTLSMTILWGWHLPAAYDAALRSRNVHDLEHVSFFVAGLLFWWPVVNPAPRVRGHVGYGWQLGYVLVSVGFGMLPCIVLGLFARRVFYAYYLTVPRMWGFSALDDQAMGWGLMAVLDGLAYAIAFISLVARMAAYEERSVATLVTPGRV